MTTDPHLTSKFLTCTSVAEIDAMRREIPRDVMMTDADLLAFASRRASLVTAELEAKRAAGGRRNPSRR